MRHATVIALVLLAGCGDSAIEGTLRWEDPPSVTGRAASGTIGNTTSHSVTVEASRMRLLDDDGRKVPGAVIRFDRARRATIPPGGSVAVSIRWKSGEAVRIDYGSGALALPSG